MKSMLLPLWLPEEAIEQPGKNQSGQKDKEHFGSLPIEVLAVQGRGILHTDKKTSVQAS